MSHLRICLFLFFVLGVVVAEFENSTEIKEKCKEVKPGSEYTRLSVVEIILKPIEIKIKVAKKFGNVVKDNIGKIIGGKSEKKNDSSCFGDVLNEINKLNPLKNIQAIPPGMHWCGAGNNAENYTDLGHFNETDACCRDHDMCKENIPAAETLLNLNNNGIFTRSSCTCDNKFHRCLKKVNTFDSKAIGKTYFDILSPQCFECSCKAECADDDNKMCKDNCKKYEWKNNPKFNEK